MLSEPEVRKNLYTSLKELGLFESEANLYITSLALGPTSIAMLAEHLSMPRPNVYKVIAGLEEKGLASFSERKRHAKTFVVDPPTVVLEQLRRKRAAVAELDHSLVGAMPDLLAQYHQGETSTKIRIFKGKEQWLKVFYQVLDETREPIKYFGSADAFIALIGWKEELEWIKERTRRNIHIDCLLVPGDDAHTLRETEEGELRTTRFYAGTEPFVPGFMLYANKVIIWQPKAPLVLLIEDEFIVQMLRSIFVEMWGKDQNRTLDV